MITLGRLAASGAAAVAVVATAASCAAPSSVVAPTPTEPDATDAEKAEAYKKGEDTLRAYIANRNDDPMKPTPANLALDPCIVEQQRFIDSIRNDGETLKTKLDLVAVKPVDYTAMPVGNTIIVTCERLTGGIYDKTGKNVTVTPDGEPQSDKARLIGKRYSLIRPTSGGRMQVKYADAVSAYDPEPPKPC